MGFLNRSILTRTFSALVAAAFACSCAGIETSKSRERGTNNVTGIVQVGSSTVELQFPSPKMALSRFETSSGSVRGNIIRIALDNGDEVYTIEPDAAQTEMQTDRNDLTAEGVYRLGAVIHCSADEKFYGLMERVVDGGQGESWRMGMTEALDLRGQKMTMFVKPTVSLYKPFFISTAGYGVFVEGDWPGEFDMAASNANEIRFKFEGPKLKFHVLYGTPTEIVQKYHDIVAKPVLPPKWAFGPWRWRDDHNQRETFWDGTSAPQYFNAEIVEDVLMMEALEIPCSVYWVDRPWAKGQRGYEDFEWDRKRLPHPEETIDWLNGRGMEFLLWVAPWNVGDMVKEGRAKGYFLEHKDQKYGLMDFTNPEAVAWWQGYVQKVIDDGVAGFKLDRAEEMVPSSMEQLTFSGMTTREMHNGYPRMYAKAIYDVLKRNREDFVVMPRAGYTGSEQYAIFWGGDTNGSEWGLRSAIIALQRAATMGFNIWGSDTGGYHSGYNRETMARWLAFSAFCPLMEVGPTRNKGLWNCPWDPNYDAELLAMWSMYAQIHEDLMDYSYAMAKRAHKTGEPIVKPMFMAFPEDTAAADHWDQYLYGDDILVCPIWKTGVREKEVYLPEGRWVDCWSDSGEVLAGPQTVTVECPLEKIPLFVRADADLNLRSLVLGRLGVRYMEAIGRTSNKPDMGELLKNAGIPAE